MVNNFLKSMPDQAAISVLLVCLLVITAFSLRSNDWGKDLGRKAPSQYITQFGVHMTPEQASALTDKPPLVVSTIPLTPPSKALPISGHQLLLAMSELDVDSSVVLQKKTVETDRQIVLAKAPDYLVEKHANSSEDSTAKKRVQRSKHHLKNSTKIYF